jgi:sulfatase maturation enzyme AslB (radical SAM superfamily)
MNIYKKVEGLDYKKYETNLFFYKSKLPGCSKILKKIWPNCQDIFQIRYSRPIMLICETVNICCNNCIICPISKMTRKKEIMSLRLFEKVLTDYSDIGGGNLSFTPKVGDIFLDKFLVERLEMTKEFPKIKGISVTTNAIFSDKFSDKEMKEILQSFERVHISIYGIDEEEYHLMTRRDTYSRMIENIQRIVNFSENPNSITFGFRLLKSHTSSDINTWIENHFHKKIPYGIVDSYMNWGGSIETNRPLPFNGKWKNKKTNKSRCLIPLIACQIFSNGDVSYCGCNDFDINEEFMLGNISKSTLAQIFNSSRNAELWDSTINLPNSCKKCVSHRSFSEFKKYKYMFNNPIDFIGG